MENIQREKMNLDDVLKTLNENGLHPSTTAEDVLCHLWRLYQQSESRLCSTAQDLRQLQQQQVEEMKDVECYVEHIRMLTEEREIPTSDFEKENEQLKAQLEQLRLDYDSQMKEVEEMLEQEGLAEIAHSNPNEQVAYLLVERATLLEKLEQSEEKLDSHFEKYSEAQLVQIHDTLEEQLQQQHVSLQESKDTIIRNPWKKLFGLYKDSTSAESLAYDEEFVKEKKLREFVERDLDEAAQRLQMAHAEIRRLTSELDMKKLEEDAVSSTELQKYKEHNSRLDKEILALRNRVRSLDSERKEYIELVEKLNQTVSQCEQERQERLTPKTSKRIVIQNGNDDSSLEDLDNVGQNPHDVLHNDEMSHMQCKVQIAERECRNNELLHKLQKLQHDYDELVERNEELESILGETQNQSKEEKANFECERDCFESRIFNLENELSQLQRSGEKPNMSDQVVAIETSREDFQQLFRSHDDDQEILQGKLATEREWRQQLESDLEAAQKVLRDEKEKCELCLECIELKHRIVEQNNNCQSTSNDFSLLNRSPAKRGEYEAIIRSLENEKEELSLAFSESKNKLDILQRQLYEGVIEKEKLFSENVQLCHNIDNTRHELQSKKEEMAKLRQELISVQNRLLKSQQSEDCVDKSLSLFQPREAMLEQQREETRQLRQDFHRAQKLCIAAEKEVKHEREKNIDLQKNSNLLQQENTKIKGELNQLQQKLLDSSKHCTSIEAILEQNQQRVKELEVELLKQSQTTKTYNTLQEKLAAAKSAGLDTEKKVFELEQQLKESNHQLRLTEARIFKEQRFEEEVKESRENETLLKRQLEEEKRLRKLSDQTVAELQLQIKGLRDKVASLALSNTELQFRIQQQESKLRIIDDDHKATFSEHLDCQSNILKLSEQLSAVQQEKDRLHIEYEHAQKLLDEWIRKYNERQLRHKAKLGRAKEVHIHEVEQCSQRIKQLLSETALMRSQAEKEQSWIQNATTENENLLQENRDLLVQMNEYEETDRNNKWLLCSLQSRLHLMEEENYQLQENVFRLSTQMGTLERILKNIQTLNLQELKNIVPPDSLVLNGTSLSLPNIGGSDMGLSECIGSLKAIQDAKFAQTASSLNASFSLSQSQPLEMSYLNVHTPRTAALP